MRSYGLTFSSGHCHSSRVGEEVAEVCRTLGIQQQDRQTITLCVTEAFNNVTEHAYQGRQGEPVRVSLNLDGEELVISIEDAGLAMAPYHLQGVPEDVCEPTDPLLLAERGRGLTILKASMAEVAYRAEPTRNVLQLRKRVTLEPSEPGS